MSVPIRPTGPACPAEAAHGPLTWGRDERWHCFSAEHDGYSGFGKWAAANDSVKVPGRSVTRSSWSRDELLPEEEVVHWARYGEP